MSSTAQQIKLNSFFKIIIIIVMEPQIQPKQGIGVELGRLQFQIISSRYYLDFLIINEKINTKPQKNREMKRIN